MLASVAFSGPLLNLASNEMFSRMSSLCHSLSRHPKNKDSFVDNSPLSKVPNPLNGHIGPNDEAETHPGVHPASPICSTLPVSPKG